MNPGARVGDRLAAAQRTHFCGRTDELAAFREVLRGTRALSVLWVHGIGGIGKSALLAEYAAIADEQRIAAIRLDGRLVDPSPGGFLLALAGALDLAAGSDPLALLADSDRVLLFVDSYELLTPIDDWLRGTFLPRLTGRIVLVLAGRDAPSPEWTAHLGWGPHVRALELRNLAPGDSRTLLDKRGVPAERHDSILEFTHGHPLALVLVSEGAHKSDAGVTFSPDRAPHVIRTLLHRIVAAAPTAAHRRALELCAHVRATSETLVAAIVEGGDPHELFEWLRGLSFVEQGPEGLFPHDVVRAALDADFRWRDPAGYRDLHRRLFGYLRERLRQDSGRARQRAFFDKLYLHRFNPIGARYHDYGTLGAVYAEPAGERDHAPIVAAVARHEGTDAAGIAAEWLRRQPAAWQIVRGAGDALLGYVASIAIDPLSGEETVFDPAVRAAMAYARRFGPLRAGERIVHHRVHGAPDVHQRMSPAINLLAAAVTTAPLAIDRLAWSFIAFVEAEPWRPIMDYIGFRRAGDADFTAGEQAFAVFAHDWRVETFDAWWTRETETSIGEAAAGNAADGAAAPLAVLSEAEFDECVRRALRDYHDATALGANPLLRSRLIFDAAGNAAGTADLQALLRDAAERLARFERGEKFHRAVWHTYVEPAGSQERAAERLGVPFSTYRYQLARGLEQIVAELWRRELRGG